MSLVFVKKCVEALDELQNRYNINYRTVDM